MEFREPLTTSPELLMAIATLRATATLEEDRYMAPDLEAAGRLVADGTLVSAVSAGLLPPTIVRPLCPAGHLPQGGDLQDALSPP